MQSRLNWTFQNIDIWGKEFETPWKESIHSKNVRTRRISGSDSKRENQRDWSVGCCVEVCARESEGTRAGWRAGQLLTAPTCHCTTPAAHNCMLRFISPAAPFQRWTAGDWERVFGCPAWWKPKGRKKGRERGGGGRGGQRGGLRECIWFPSVMELKKKKEGGGKTE